MAKQPKDVVATEPCNVLSRRQSLKSERIHVCYSCVEDTCNLFRENPKTYMKFTRHEESSKYKVSAISSIWTKNALKR